jgi:arylsulfatase A-like enzyme
LNILFIAIDTLRADHLGCYAYARNTSPRIDGLAGRGAVFDSMIAPAIPTHPSFVTMMTGQYPITHGVVAHGGSRAIPKSAPWLPAILQKEGYTTCAVDNLGEWQLGFSNGYEFYIDPTRRRGLSINADNREINRRAIPWLAEFAKEKFFLFVHYWDTHTPYLPPRAYRDLFYKRNPCDPNNKSLDGLERHPLGRMWRETWFNKLGDCLTDADYIEALYDGSIRFCDEGVAKLLHALDETGVADDTLAILVSDHGEMMYRHKIFFDHHGLYDGNLRVPLIMAHPAIAPKRIPHLAAHVDLAPTILDLAGIAVPAEMEGFSLAPYLRGPEDKPVREFVVSEECTWQMKWSIRTATHKFIKALEEDFYQTPMRELYDLRADPHEFDNVAAREPKTARRLEKTLDQWIKDMMARNGLRKDPLVAHGITLGNEWKKFKREV